jgi:histidinol phosphatase-like PHP family hydrolase
MIFDFHTHTFYSDGLNSPIELIRFAHSNGYSAIAITDHASPANIDEVIKAAINDCKIASGNWDIRAIPGVELTHVPAGSIADLAKYAKENGAVIVAVHGESIVEPVEPGTNLSAVKCRYVDFLAHPGLITEETVEIAVKNDVYLELTRRGGHCLSNGLVAKLGLKFGAKFLVNSDSHSHKDLYKADFQKKVALSAGIPESEADNMIQKNSNTFLKKISQSFRF